MQVRLYENLLCREKPLKRTTMMLARLLKHLDLAPTDQVISSSELPETQGNVVQMEALHSDAGPYERGHPFPRLT